MDYIINKINNNIAICDKSSYDYITSLRKRIEYILFFIMGYLWNKNTDKLSPDKRLKIITSFDRISIGDFVSAISTLDINHEILPGKAAYKLIEKYPSIRNIKMGHGYASGEELKTILEEIYTNFLDKIQFISKNCSLIIVENKNDNEYYGIRMDWDTNGRKDLWYCPIDIFPQEENFPRTYVYIDNEYYKLSPFITINKTGIAIQEYAFSSLNDSLTGNIKLCPLFNTDIINIVFSEFSKMSEEDEYRQISPNGTVMNTFECNYSTYQDVGIFKIVIEFLLENRANVFSTIWGHGGVGKTACIQNVCETLFYSKEKKFDYIVFVTAKDRIYNPSTGKIIPNKSKYVRKYIELLEIILQTMFPNIIITLNNEEALNKEEERIILYKGKLLIVIDDYETFSDDEKIKIHTFVKKLDINYHKVVFTTRNLRLAIGSTIPTNEFDVNTTIQFLESIVNKTSPEMLATLKTEILRSGISDKIHKATKGRPIFIYQFAFLFMQTGIREDLFKELDKGNDAKDFLYGRIYSYLSAFSKIVFSIIPSIVNDDLLFRFDILRFILQKEIQEDDKYDLAIDELVNQLIIERYNDDQGRVYAKELLIIMQDYYDKSNESFKESNRRLIESIGGKELSGTLNEAILHEADQSRVSGNTTETISKYRRVLNLSNCPFKIKKQALINASSYLSVNDLNPKAASDLIKEYIRLFKDDEQIAYQYIVLLWQQDEEKANAISFIRNFFSGQSGHKKTSNQYLQFFALGTSYCSYYDMNLRRYDSIDKRYAQYSQTINEFGKELYEAVKDCYPPLRSGVKHVVQMGLSQTARICSEFNIDNVQKLEYGSEICSFAFEYFNPYFSNQIRLINQKINQKLSMMTVKHNYNESGSIHSWWSYFDEDGFKFGDIIEGIISGIVSYGIFVKFGKGYQGLIHISQISNKYITFEELKSNYSMNQNITAIITRIDKENQRIELKKLD